MGLFKKREVLDLTKKGIDSDVPTEGYFKRKNISSSLVSQNTSPLNQASSSFSPATTETTSPTPNSGGFFNFFGDSSSSTPTPATSSTNTSNFVDNEKLKSQLDDLNYRFSRVLDRLELLEKKMDRFERKSE